MTLNTIRSSAVAPAAAGVEWGPGRESSSQTGAPPAAPDHHRDATWRRFESLIAARGAAVAPVAQEGEAAQRPTPVTRSPLTSPPASQPDARALAPVTPAARQRRGAWFYRFQGAAFTCVVALAAIAAARWPEAPLLSSVLASGPASDPAIAVAATVDQSAAFADAFAETARVEAAAAPQPVTAPPVGSAPVTGVGVADNVPESEAIARIAAADPPYRVVLNVAPDANPRDVARLDTAIRAWGFAPPEQRVAPAPVALPEVVFHAGRDRETALIVAQIADRILAEAVLTPPDAAASDPDRAGLIEINVTTR